MSVTNEALPAMLTLSFLGLIPFASLPIFLAIYFGRIKRAQIMKQQNGAVSSDQSVIFTIKPLKSHHADLELPHISPQTPALPRELHEIAE
ncbi:unnamed protein product [Litomosoides sigmodontis]|uniref:Uncharacterized protein n=1 Tax=Litomosoides sigmodontis TaxID=42156 RepID=A0A3P6TWA8_LITSI|nr:unnamed protein product [Litomosoides sigmodontis]